MLSLLSRVNMDSFSYPHVFYFIKLLICFRGKWNYLGQLFIQWTDTLLFNSLKVERMWRAKIILTIWSVFLTPCLASRFALWSSFYVFINAYLASELQLHLFVFFSYQLLCSFAPYIMSFVLFVRPECNYQLV